MQHAPLVVTLLTLLTGSVAAAETIRCAATHDADLSCDDNSEKSMNFGDKGRLKLKGWKQFPLVDFDVSAAKGKKIESAALLVTSAGGASDGGNGGLDVRWMTVSTVSTAWDEAGVSYNEPSKGAGHWGFVGAQCYDVMLGNGHTLRHDGQSNADGGQVRLVLDARLARALVAGASHGLMIMDGTAGVSTNNFIQSREGGNGPVLELVLGGPDKAPAKPAALTIRPEPNYANADHGAFSIELTVPDNAFAYAITVDGKAVSRWQIPFASEVGKPQRIVIQDVNPDAKVNVELVALSGSGLASAPVSVSGAASARTSVPELPVSPFQPKAGEPKSLGTAKIYAFPEVTKVLPTTGLVSQEPGMDDFKRKNPVWDGASGTIRLAAARGEIVSFQIGIDGAVQDCAITVSELAGAGGKIAAANEVKFWRNWYTGDQSEYALPWTGKISCPMSDNNIAGQTHQAVTVDVSVPAKTKAGDYKGTVTLTAGANTVTLPFLIKVYNAIIPDELHFNPELNAYGNPGEPGTERFKNSHILAHYNRSTINVVPYKQSAGADASYCPDVDATGKPTNWTRFDTKLSGLFDGSWFAANPRANMPVACFYLPLNEGWPLDFKQHYNPGCPIPGKPSDAKQRLAHHIRAKPFSEAVDDTFKQAFVNCTQGFVQHASEKKWLQTQFHGFLNGKQSFDYTLWLLDEPFQTIDWMVINNMADLFLKGVNDPQVSTPKFFQDYFEKGLSGMKRDRPTFIFRGDISRPQWQGSCSDGRMGIMYANNEHFTMRRLTRDMRERGPMTVCTYGGPNAVNEANWGSAAWCLQAYCSWSDGVLPWQSLGEADRLTRPDNDNGYGLIIDAGPFGNAVASLRLHAMRRGAQDCELLRLLQLKMGWDREQIGALVSKKVPVLTSVFKQTFQDEAASASYRNLTSSGFLELKEGVLQLLDQAPAPAKKK